MARHNGYFLEDADEEYFYVVALVTTLDSRTSTLPPLLRAKSRPGMIPSDILRSYPSALYAFFRCPPSCSMGITFPDRKGSIRTSRCGPNRQAIPYLVSSACYPGASRRRCTQFLNRLRLRSEALSIATKLPCRCILVAGTAGLR